jgi:hypothetical protein
MTRPEKLIHGLHKQSLISATHDKPPTTSLFTFKKAAGVFFTILAPQHNQRS